MEKWYGKKAMDENVMTNDVMDSAFLEMADAVASNSLGGNLVKSQKATQKEMVEGAAHKFLAQQKHEAAEFGMTTTESDIANYVGANFEVMNAHAVAAITRKGITDAQSLQKNLARVKYDAIGDIMEPDMLKNQVVREPTGRMDSKGNPVYRLRKVNDIPAEFPVDLTGVRRVAEDELAVAARLVKDGAESNEAFKQLTPEMKELIGFADKTDFKTAAKKLSDMKAESRDLVGVEKAAVRKRSLDMAIDQLDAALNDAMQRATDAGVVAPNGQTLKELKTEADAIWKEQADDFGNKFIKQILDHTDAKNGSPEELARLFLKDETHALKIMKALDQGQGQATTEAARQAIKGSVAESIFMPFDAVRGTYRSPSFEDLEGRKDALMKLFSKEEYDDMVDIANSLARVNGEHRANVLAFAQQAKESGKTIQIVQDIMAGQNPLPNFQDLATTLLTAMGGAKMLTSPRAMKAFKWADDPTIPPYLRRQSVSRAAHMIYNYHQTLQDTMTDEERKRWEERIKEEQEYRRALQSKGE